MTSNRSLGPLLAAAGGVVAIAAVITGFIVVGGPGDARDRRLDDLTMGRISNAIYLAQCAFNAVNAAPLSLGGAPNEAMASAEAKQSPDKCEGAAADIRHVKTGGEPVLPGDVAYTAIDASHIRLCGNFHRPYAGRDRDDVYSPSDQAFPQLNSARPAGVHCYEIELVKGADTAANRVSHAGHMGDFE